MIADTSVMAPVVYVRGMTMFRCKKLGTRQKLESGVLKNL